MRTPYAAIAVLSIVTVAYEVLLTRLLSVTTWYSLGFAVLSIAMLGLTRGAVSAAKARGPLTPDELQRGLIQYAVSLALAAVVATLIPIWIRVSIGAALAFAVVAAATAAPFVFGGSLVARLLATPGVSIGRLYAVDLAAAAVGAVVPLALLGPLGAPGALLLLAAALAAAAAAVGTRRVAAAGLSGLLLLAAIQTRIWPASFRPTLAAKVASEKDLTSPQFEHWNALSYVLATAFRHDKHPFMWSAVKPPGEGDYEESLALIDGEASTPILAYRQLDELSYLRHDVTAAAHALRPDGTACIIGLGGGRDVLAALQASHSQVVGADINPLMVRMVHEAAMRSPFSLDPRVVLVAEDGRQRFGASRGECRVLQASLVDTWAATGAGAFAHTEATLYTREAWAGFLDAVEPDGVLTFSRWFAAARIDEASRLIALAVASLLDRHVERPEDHLAMLGFGNVATLLVSPQPFSARDVATIESLANREGFTLLVAPGHPAATPLIGALLATRDPDALERPGEPLGLDTSAPTDNRPFFFQLLRMGSLGRVAHAPEGVLDGNVRAAAVLGLTFVALLLLTALLLVPALAARSRDSSRALGASGAIYFAALGLGFMLAEVALVQRMHLVLAHPTLALVFVLAGLLAAMGAGSALSTRLLSTPRRVALAALIAAALLAALPHTVIGPLAAATRFSPLGLRAAWATATSAGLGLVLGMLFPSGLRFISHPQGLPLALALNGAAGVVGGVLAIVISVRGGISWSFAAAAFAYLVAAARSPAFWARPA
jgi:hypothetical protein